MDRAYRGRRLPRITRQLLAMATASWPNWATSAPITRSLTAYDN